MGDREVDQRRRQIPKDLYEVVQRDPHANAVQMRFLTGEIATVDGMLLEMVKVLDASKQEALAAFSRYIAEHGVVNRMAVLR